MPTPKAKFHITAEDRTKRAFDSANKNISGFVREVVSVKGAIAGLIGAGGLGAAVTKAVDFADSIDKAAQRAGISTTALQELRFAGDQVGVSTKQLDDGMRRLTRRLGEFANSGGGPAAKALEGLNVAALDVEGNLRPTEQVFEDIIAKMQGMESQAQRAAYAAQLFGDDAGPQLELLLRQGTAGIEELRAAAQATGGVIGEELIANGVAAQDAMARLSFAFTGAANSIILQLAPQLEGLADFLATDVPKGVEYTAQAFEYLRGSMLEGAAGINDFLANVAEGMQFLADAAGFTEAAESFGNVRAEYEKTADSIQDLKLAYEEASDAQREFATRPGRALSPIIPSAPGVGITQASGKVEADANKALQEEATKTAAIMARLYPERAKAEQFAQDLELIKAKFGENSDEVRRLQQEFADATGGPKQLAESAQESSDEMSSFAEQAARNMQDSFADFLFDPFDNGVRGMLDGFLDTLRRMAAEAAAAQVFESLGVQDVLTKGVGAAFSGGFDIPFFEDGTDFVPKTGLAVVHRGEKIIPAKFNKPGAGNTSTTNISINIPQGTPIDTRSANQVALAASRAVSRAQARNG